jgi:hypothetical protein
MSVDASAFVWGMRPDEWYDPELKATKMVIMLALADHSNSDGISYPGVTSLAKKARISERQLQKILRQLEASGDLRVEYNEGKKTSSGTTNCYYLVKYRVKLGLERGVTHDTPSKKQGVNSTTPLKSQGVSPTTPQGVSPTTPKPSLQPSVTDQPSEKKESTPNTEPTTSILVTSNPFSVWEKGENGLKPIKANGSKKVESEGKPDTTAGVAAETETAYTPEHMAMMKKKADEIVTAMAKSMEIE